MIGPLLFGHDVRWSPTVWLVMATGAVIIAAFLQLERAVARRGGMPLIDLSLLADKAFMRGLAAAFFFFFANLSFYLVMTIFMQRGLQIPPLRPGWPSCLSRWPSSSPRGTAACAPSIAARWC